MRVLWRSLVVLCLVASPWVLAPEARAGDASFSVIVHSGNPTTAVRKSDLSKIFLKKIAKWPHGVPISVADQKASSEVRQAFSQGVHARVIGQFGPVLQVDQLHQDGADPGSDDQLRGTIGFRWAVFPDKAYNFVLKGSFAHHFQGPDEDRLVVQAAVGF